MNWRLAPAIAFLAGAIGSAAAPASAPEEVTSPDGRLVAWVQPTPNLIVDTALGAAEATELWVRDTRDGARRMLVRGHNASRPQNAIAEMSNLHFSHDSRLIYFDSVAWVTSEAVHAVKIVSGTEWFITDGSTVEVVRHGPNADNLLVERALIKVNTAGESSGRSFYRWVYTGDGFAITELAPIDN